MTGEYSLIFPCAISVFVAVGFAKQFSTSYFQAVLDARKMPYLSNLR
jgi:H+/Cl- antiporter ClcA